MKGKEFEEFKEFKERESGVRIQEGLRGTRYRLIMRGAAKGWDQPTARQALRGPMGVMRLAHMRPPSSWIPAPLLELL
jgi:hypothetical protein